jgi:hypothetical protein
MYGIELQRANLTNKTEADKDQDNDIFWIHVNKSATGTIPAGLPGAGQTYYELYRDNTLTITGLFSPSTAFNIDLSPNTLKQGYIQFEFVDKDDKNVKFVNKNNRLAVLIYKIN